MSIPDITWNIPADIAWQGFSGGLTCAAVFLTTVVLLEWFWA